jgi:hypothetical protein
VINLKDFEIAMLLLTLSFAIPLIVSLIIALPKMIKEIFR